MEASSSDQEQLLSKRNYFLEKMSDEEKGSEDENAWEDPDDQLTEVDLAAKSRFRKLMRAKEVQKVTAAQYSKIVKEFNEKQYEGFNYTKWTKNTRENGEEGSEKEDRIEKMLKTDMVSSIDTDDVLPKDVLLTNKLSELNYSDRLKAVVQTIDLHPINQDRVLIGGLDKVLKIFEIERDQENNSYDFKLKNSVHFDQFPIKCAKFYNQKSEEVILNSIKKHIIFHDIVKGKSDILPNVFFHKQLSYRDNCIQKFELSPNQSFMAFFNEKNNGLMGVLNPRSRQYLFDLKMNETCTDLIFLNDYELLSAGDKGNLYLWDLRNRMIVNRFKDDGAVRVNSLAYRQGCLAVGSSGGIVNVYDFNSSVKSFKQSGDTEQGSEAAFKPKKRYDNLVTAINNIQISQDTKKIIFSSEWVKNAIRVANNVENCVYKNWPNFNTKLGLVSTFKASEEGNRLFIGSTDGLVKLYSID